MKAVYLETSAVVAWLLGESTASRIKQTLLRADEVVVSALVLLEAKRALIRYASEGRLKAVEKQRLFHLLESVSAQWIVVEITSEIRHRAAEPFPVEPVRSLDAIHLATALEMVQTFPDLRVLSFDQKISVNLEPLGFEEIE